uniref:Exonuclease 3'-5' domain containing 1 n=1 Tax=Salvator merianae TaxID=96440 RepID=A0A8D0CBM7_SALMN
MDISSDCHFFHDILGKTMKITLKCGVFQGVLQHVDSSRSIFLNKVKDLESDRHIPGVKKFFGHEIVNVELLDDPEQLTTERKRTINRDVPSSKTLTVDSGEQLKQNPQNPNVVSQETYQLYPANFRYSILEGEDVKYIVIDQFQKKFGSAIMHIKKQKVCAIAAEGVNLCRYGKLSWLQVIHDCRWLSDCLAHQYGTVLSNVFDTQVADVFQFSVETGGFLPQHISTLQDCLMRYLGLSYRRIAFMEQRQHAVEKNPEIWFVRPLPPPLLNVLALETAYLIPLRITLLDEIMSDVTTLVDGYLNVFREGSADPLGSAQISCMELPQELRQLTDFQKERRQRAMQKYQLNKEGLLIRKQMESEGKMVAKKEINQSNGTDTILSNKAVPVLSISQKARS